jgi:tRNA threonylcarbamoyladenosine biosynthesis protein TsaB
MKILAIETSGRGGSVALGDGDAVIERSVGETRDQTGRLLPMIDELLTAASVAIADLDALAFGQGPGSFTGLRVAAAVVQGLGLGSGVPIVPVSSMAGLVQQAWRRTGATVAVVCIDARMDEVYWGHFAIDAGLAVQTRPEAIGQAAAVTAPAGTYACIGDAFDRYQGVLAGICAGAEAVLAGYEPVARDLLPLAAARRAAGVAVDPVDALPTYLRDSTAWKRL